LLSFDCWVVATGVIEFSIVVLLIEVSSNGLGDSKEVLEEDIVADVGVEVVLEVLEHVHVLLNESVSSDSWERERFIEKLPGVHLESWGSSLLLLHGLGDVLDVSPVSSVKASGEHIDLVIKLIGGLVKVDAWVIELDVLGIRVGGLTLG